MPFVPGIKRLSRLVIDTSKDWASWRILNLGVPTTEGDALRKGTRLSMGEMPDGPSGQVLTARGAGLNPIYTGVRGEVRTTDPVPLEEGQFWYRSDLWEWRVVKGPPFGEILRSAASPATSLSGIGGDSTAIWHSDAGMGRIYELSTTDFSVVRNAVSPTTEPAGIGGNSTTIWYCDLGVDRVYELSTTNFSVVRSAASPATGPRGIGGDSTTIWHCDLRVDRVYELSTADFSVVRSVASPASTPQGIGGDSTTIWHSDWTADSIYELSVGFTARTIVTS